MRGVPVAHTAAAGAGIVLALLTHFPTLLLAPLALVAVVPLLVCLRAADSRTLRWVGVVFFGCWFLPTTAWYYSFMPVWLAPLASVGIVLLMSNLFCAFRLTRRLGFAGALGVFVTAWLGWEALRLYAPVLRDWWFPHLGYAVWRNPALVAPAALGGELGVEAVVLGANAVVALLLVSVRPAAGARRPRALVAAVVVLALLGGGAGAGLVRVTHPRTAPAVLVAVQQRTGGVDVPATAADVDRLERATTDGLAAYRFDSRRAQLVVWPENKLSPELAARAGAWTTPQRHLLVHRVDPVPGEKPLKRAVLYGPDGREVFSNTKDHIAPGEVGQGRRTAEHARIAGLNVTAYVCYDMHYPDVAPRIAGADLVLVPLNDSEFAHLQRTFHAADLTIRSAQTHTWVVAASTDGPSLVVDDGRVLDELAYDRDAVLVRP